MAAIDVVQPRATALTILITRFSFRFFDGQYFISSHDAIYQLLFTIRHPFESSWVLEATLL
jgi:hypothetical protein